MEAFYHLFQTAFSDRDERTSLPAGVIDDASRLNETRIAEMIIPSSTGKALEEQLQTYLQQTREHQFPVSIAGARHTMGGQTFTPGGSVLDTLNMQEMSLDEEHQVLHVQAGARWSQVLPYLHERRYAVQVMQANNAFSIGGSLGANCHGWQPASPPIASTVQAFRIMLADGSILRCSRTENTELFSLVLGGYGLFGIVLDVELAVCANDCYRPKSEVVASRDYSKFYQEQVLNNPEIGLAYGRFAVEPGVYFLKEILFTGYHTVPDELDFASWPLEKPGLTQLRRAVFRSSVGNAGGKALRWSLEQRFGALVQNRTVTRTALLNEGVSVFENRNQASTDILHEYFIPLDQLEPLLEQFRKTLPRHEVDLLNVTIRFLRADSDSFLRYADKDMFALVMLFNQPRSRHGEQRMATLTRALIDIVQQLGGRYYLPYRLHATPEQFFRSYPQAHEFFALKRKYDPQERFQNMFYQKYGLAEHASEENS